MTFGLPSWLKSRYAALSYEVPVWYPSRDEPDHREWIVGNGLGGYSSSTISGANTRRYHGVLVAPFKPPCDRRVVLTRVDELVTVGNIDYELSTNHWASGVVAPTGYKLIESFTILPTPTWVFSLGKHYLIKQLCVPQGSNEAHIGYFWLPDENTQPLDATISLRFLTGFRSFHDEVRGSANKRYAQALTEHQCTIALNNSRRSLLLSWTRGTYEIEEQWWWSYHWSEEAARGNPDQEDLCLLGALTAQLNSGNVLSVCASLDNPPEATSVVQATEAKLARQNMLISKSVLPKSPETNLLTLACDQFIVRRDLNNKPGLSVMAGFPWLTDSGRDTMIALPGLTLAVRRFDEAKTLLATYGRALHHGLMPHRFEEHTGQAEFQSADAALWWAWSLYHYFRSTKDVEFLKEQFPLLKEVAHQYVEGTASGITTDPHDGLLRCGDSKEELTWMDARVADIPITPRSGKPVEVCALWHNFLEVLRFFAQTLGENIDPFLSLCTLTHNSMQKFWNSEKQCLYDVIESGNRPGSKSIDLVRPNQILAVSLPFRAFTQIQEKAILTTIDRELLTPVGLRSLSPADPSYQGKYGCGFSHADRYHRDLSYHQGTVWPWFMGPYCDALLNVHGPLPETYAKMRLLLQPLLNHLLNEACIGSLSEIFDGNTPHMPRGCFAQAWSVAETMRILSLVLRGR